MFRHGTAHTVRRRFLHAPSSCRVGCRMCLGSLVAGRGHPAGRRAVFGASAALLTIGTLLVSPPGRDNMAWREQAVVLAAELSRLGPTDGTAAGALSYELELLGYTPVPQLPAGFRETPPDDDGEDGEDGDGEDGDGEDGDGEDGDSGTDEPEAGDEDDTDADETDETDEDGPADTESGDRSSEQEDAEDTGSDESDEADGTDARTEQDGELDGDAARGPGSDSMGTGWEEAAQELADLLAEFGTEDEAARALADALAEAGFDPSGGSRDGGSRDGGSRDGAGSGGERESDRRAPGAGGGGGEVLWDADVETGDLSQFEGGGDDPQQEGAPEPEIVDGRDGDHAVSFTIPGGGQRNEVLPDAQFTDGDKYWFGFSALLEDGFPVDDGWQLITQWKNDGTGSPPLSLNVENGEYLLHGGYAVGKDWSESIGPATAGEWVDWVIYVEFEGGAGRVDVWQDGEQVVEGLVPDGGTLYPGKDSYLKIGYYRDTGIGTEGTVVFDNWKMGTSYDAVAPGGAAAGSSSGDSSSGGSSSGGSSSGGSTDDPSADGPSSGTSSDEPSAAPPSAERRTVTDDEDATAGADTRPRSSVPFVEGR